MKGKRLLTILLCVMLTGTLLPAGVFASENVEVNTASEVSAKVNESNAPVPEMAEKSVEKQTAEPQKEITVTQEKKTAANDPEKTVPTNDSKEAVQEFPVQDEAGAGTDASLPEKILVNEDSEDSVDSSAETAVEEKDTEKPVSAAVPAGELPERTETEPIDEIEKNMASDTGGQAELQNGEKNPEAEVVPETNYPVFSQNRTVGGVKVTVSADAGVFPENAALSVAAVPSSQVESMIEEERAADVNVTSSYTFDIKVLDAGGNEIQPKEGQTVRVSFSLEEVADPNLDTQIYHISDVGRADALDAVTAGQVATVETDGFSLYTVEFTYNDLQYVLQGGESVALSAILKMVGLSGEPTNAVSSDPALFSVEKKGDVWTVKASKAFSTSETLSVIINGVEYEISVTDPPVTEVSTWADLKTALKSDGDYTLTANVKPDDPYWDDALEVPSGVTATLDLNGYTVDRGYTDDSTDTWDGSVFNVKGTLTVTDGSASQSGVITGGWNDQYGGGVQIQGGTFNLQGGTITGNRAGKTGFFGADGLGGGVYMQSGTFNMSGGAISGNKALGSSMGDPLGHGGGVYITNGTFNFTGGTISGNDAGMIGGGVFLASTYSGHDGKINISGGASVTGNTVGSTTRNIYLEEGGKINIAGALTGTVGVTMQTPGVITSGLPGNGTAANFKSDDAAYEVSLTDTDEAQLAEPTPYPLWVGGVQVTSGNADDILGDGTATYDPGTTTLTLTNANITAASSNTYSGGWTYSNVVYARGLALTVSLSGDNTLGDGSADYVIFSDGGALTISGGGLTAAAGSSSALVGENALSITGSTVTATASGSDCIRSGYGSVTITDSTIAATGGRYGISAGWGSLTVSGNSVVTAEGNTQAIYAGGVTLNDGLAYVEGSADAKKAVIAKPYPLWVGGVQVTSGNLSGDCDGGGTWSYAGDETGGTLTLDNANITGTYTYPGPTHETANIYADGLDLTFSLVGDSSLSGADRGVWMRTGDLTITGGGSLSASSTSLFGYGVNVVGDLTVTGGSKLTAKASGILGYGIFPSGVVTIEDGSTVTATGGASDISAPGGITITGSTVAATSTAANSFGLWTSAITITDSTVTATGGEYGISAISGGLTVSGEDSVVTAEGGTAAIDASGGVTLNDGLVYIEGSGDATKAVIAKGYTVTYKVAGGTWADGTAADKTETVAEGAKPAAVPTGMIAAKGYRDGAWDADPATATITEAATFTYAFEAIPTYTVTYKVVDGTWADGTAADKTETVAEGTKPAEVPTGMIAAKGYRDGAWDAEPTEAITEAKTFTYSFELIPTYTVTFVDYDGKTVLKEAVSYEYGTSAADIALPDEPKREADAQYSYTFAGWDPEIAEVTGDAVYTAVYTATPIPVPIEKGKLTFDLAGGTLDGKTGTITIEANVGDTIKLPGAPTREGYTFQYWKGSQYEAGVDYKVEGDHAFTAEWEENNAKTYTVTFDANGHGTAPAAQTVEEGKKVSKPKDPTASGYTFGGWFTDKECKNAFDFETAVTKDVTLYAKWTAKESSAGSTTGTSTSGGTAAKTGDESNVGLWFMLMAASLLVLFLIAKKRKGISR